MHRLLHSESLDDANTQHGFLQGRADLGVRNHLPLGVGLHPLDQKTDTDDDRRHDHQCEQAHQGILDNHHADETDQGQNIPAKAEHDHVDDRTGTSGTRVHANAQFRQGHPVIVGLVLHGQPLEQAVLKVGNNRVAYP